MNTYFANRSDGINYQNELTKEQLQKLGGTRISFSSHSVILPITDKEFLDKSTIYSTIKSPAIKASLTWNENDKDNPITYDYNNPESYSLRNKLLSFGGNCVCIPEPEEDYINIMKYGQFWYGRGARLMKGQPNQCHKNSCELWKNNKHRTKICTGYALSEDGIWRQHSWLIEFKSASNKIIETTKLRVAYFGFIMNYKQCEDFVYANL